MTVNLIKIGNSRGVILPASLLKAEDMDTGISFDVVFRDGQIILTPKREFTGNFTGPFAALDVPGRESLWGDPDEDPSSIAARLRSDKGRELEEW